MSKNLVILTASLAVTMLACQTSRGPLVCTDDSAALQARTQNPNWKNAESLAISKEALNATGEKFERHPNYVSLMLPYSPMKPFYEDLQKRAGRKLISRGESHVTVLTPPEFIELKAKLSIDDINQIVEKNQIQESKLSPICFGEGRAPLNGKEELTYFIVVESKSLLKIRRAIAEVFHARGGSREGFNPDHFYPHITVAFTKADLHEQNGVIKDEASCLSPLVLKN